MKILFVSNLFGASARGGAERIAFAEAQALVAAGHAVTVVTAAASGAAPADRAPGTLAAAKEPGTPAAVIGIKTGNLFPYVDLARHGFLSRFVWHLLDMTDAVSARAFAAVLASERPDAVHTHNLMGLGFMLPSVIRAAAAQRRRAGASPLRHVHTAHDVQLLHPSGLLTPADHVGPLARMARWTYVRVMRRLMGSPDVVLFPSVFLRSLHEQHGFFPRSDRRIAVNPVPDVVGGGSNGLGGAPPFADASAWRETSRFLFVGQLEAHKGVMLLLDAWALSGLAASGTTLEIAGEGSMSAALHERAASLSGVTFSGKLTGASLAAAYDRASYLVVPSLVIENQPTVILEAFSRGVPAVAAITGGIPELVHEGKTGFLFAAGDAAACAAALQRAEASAERARLRQACLDWAATHGMDGHVAALMAAYR